MLAVQVLPIPDYQPLVKRFCELPINQSFLWSGFKITPHMKAKPFQFHQNEGHEGIKLDASHWLKLRTMQVLGVTDQAKRLLCIPVTLINPLTNEQIHRYNQSHEANPAL